MYRISCELSADVHKGVSGNLVNKNRGGLMTNLLQQRLPRAKLRRHILMSRVSLGETLGEILGKHF